MIEFDHIEYLTFDCYGTLIDWETGILEVIRPILEARSVDLDDDVLLETYSDLEAKIEAGRYVTYRRFLLA